MTSIEYRVYQQGYGTFVIMKYEVLKRTPCGRWVAGGLKKSRRKRFVRNNSRFCSPTIKEAIEVFFKRKKDEVLSLEVRLEAARDALAEQEEYTLRMLQDFAKKGVSHSFPPGGLFFEHD